MPPVEGHLGILKPIGGGDPVELTRGELKIGRRPTNDIMLDFENVSGKHCVLRLVNGVWHVRDLGSTNGTWVNGARISNEQTVMPDDELGIASRLYRIDYEPSGPALMAAGEVFDEDLVETRKRTSLLELAGLAHMDDRPKPASKRPEKPTPEPKPAARKATPKAPEQIPHAATDDLDEFDDILPATPDAPSPGAPKGVADDDFLKFIEEELK